VSEKLKDEISIFHDRNIYLKRRIVPIIGEIDEEKFEEVFKNISILDDPNREINIVINSPGGCVTQGKAIYDVIRASDSHVNILVCGEACSAASFILQAGDNRYITENSRIMIHVGAEALDENHPRNIDAEYSEYRKDEKWLENIYLEKIKVKKKRYSRSQIKKLLQFDKYIHPMEAIDMNLVDDIKEKLW
jgi:ATP-dependent Clp protease protease subunit